MGIGTDSPETKMQVQRASNAINTDISFKDGGGTRAGVIGMEGATTNDMLLSTLGGIRFYTNSNVAVGSVPSNERMRLTTTGALAFGGATNYGTSGQVLTSNGNAAPTWQAAGGGGASSLNGLTDCLVDTGSLYVGEVPSGLSGNPQGNTILGIEAGDSNTSGTENTNIGYQAGYLNATGTNRVCVGYEAGKNGTANTGVFVGALAGQGSGTNNASGNVAMGWSALRAVAQGGDNVAIGFQAGRSIGSAANRNTMLGSFAGYGNTGNYTVMVGREAGRNNTNTGHISIGYQAGFSNTSGTDNTNIGYQAGYSNTVQGYRTTVGFQAGYANTGTQNVFIGQRSGSGAGSGEDNAAVGSNTLTVASAGSFNAVVGNLSLQNCTGSNNSTLGYKAGQAVTSGSNNVAIGFQAMDANTDGIDNVAIGYNALGAATSDNRCTAIGVNALLLQNQTFGPENTAVGYAADDANVTGFQRTCIGAGTGGGATGNNITNLGYAANPSSSSVSNEITLGNSSVSALRCAVTTITSVSDERDKSEIKDLGYGLAFIDALQPREFVWDNRVETNKDGEEFYSANKGKKDFGFIAQEVKKLDNDTLRLVYDENPEKLELSYGKLVPILVQAVKELKAEIELLKS